MIKFVHEINGLMEKKKRFVLYRAFIDIVNLRDVRLILRAFLVNLLLFLLLFKFVKSLQFNNSRVSAWFLYLQKTYI